MNVTVISSAPNSLHASPNSLRRDADHLQWLGTAATVLGATTMILASLGLLPVLGGAALLGATSASGSELPFAFAGWFSLLLGAAIVLSGWLVGGLTIYAGRCLARRQKKKLVQVVAALNCLSLPFGTLWGVCALVVLSRPSVSALFDDKMRTPYV